MHFFLRTAIIFSFLFLTGFSVNAQHTKTCDADHMTDLIKEKFPEHADAWEDFHQRVIPELVKNQPPAQLTAGEILRIPVVIHVIHTGEAVGTGANLSVAQIQAQLDILNEDFGAQNDNFNQTPAQWTSVIGNPNIQFCLANVDPAGNPSNGITRHNLTVTGTNTSDSNIEDEIKPPTTWNSNIYYNIWTLPIPGTSANGGTVGYAYLPNNFTIGSDFDGTVVDWRWFGGPGFNQSGYKTLTHETGHYLGLPHTFNDTDCSGDDNIEDTPNISAATASLIPGLSCSNDNFPTGPSSCGNEHMYVNYMDYVNSDYCYTSFTAGQIAVMRGVLEGDRPFNYGSRLALINNSNTACASAANNIGITSVAQPTAGTNCTPGPVTPQVTVGNFGTETVTTFSVSYQIDNGTLVSENFVDNIASGGTVTVSLPIFTPPANAYDFTVYTQNPNGVTDTQTDNDTTVVSSVLVTPQGLPLLEDFTAIQINPTAAGSYTFNPDADVFAWQRVPTSANGSAGGSILFDNYDGDSGNNPFGTIDAFISPVLDLSNSNSTTLTFDVAYARYENNGEFFNDSMRILISTDCGSNYNELVFNEGGATLETGAATGAAFSPSSGEWENRTVNLNNYDGQPTVSIAFVNISGWGNRLFLDNINITEDENVCDLAASIVTNNVTCFGDFSGSAQAIAQSGTPPYSYQWNNGLTDETIDSGAGVVSVTITDANGCNITVSNEILEPQPISLGVNKTNESTAGANDGTATTLVSGGTGSDYSFNWSNNATTASVTNLAPNEYTVTVTDESGCTKEVSFVILPGQANCDLAASIVTNDVSCFGDFSGSAQAIAQNGTPPYSYQWNNGLTDETIDSGAGVVSVTITDANGCNITVSDEILEPQPISLGVNKTNETTAGANDGTATTLVSGGTGSDYSFNWSNNATTASVTNLAPNDYTVTVTDENGCTQEASFVILPGQADCSQLSLTLQPTAASCADSNNGSINAIPTGGSGSYQYAWSNGMSTQNINNLSSGTYQLTITDQMGCTLSKTTIVNAPVALTATISATESQTASAPPTGTATVNANGGTGNYTYQWSNGDNTATIIELSVGTYSVSVYDSNQCTWTGSVEVTEEVIDCSSLNLEITSNNISCFGMADGFIHATASGGSPEYIYQWNNGMNSANIVDLPAGIYQLTITDINGCSVVETTEITESTPLLANLHSNSDPCSVGGTVSVGPTGGIGGYQVSWSNGASGFTNDVNQSGTYQVTITDGAGCTVTDAIDMTIVDTALELIVSTENTSCADNNDGLAAATVAGGTTPYHYNWSTGSTENSIENLAAGTYSVEITDATGCQQNQIFTVTAPDPVLLDCSGTPESNGVDGFVQVSVSGGIAPYQYIWSTGDTGSFVQEITNGSYDVTVTDQNGCSSICTVDLIPTNTEMPANFATLDVFPNPASEQLFIQANLLESESVNLSLVNLIGQAVWTANTNGTAIQQIIEVADLAAGTYLLRLETAKGSAVRKVVIF